MNAQRAATGLPEDFPRWCGGSLAGVHPKLAVTRVDDMYIGSPTDDEHRSRYLACEDLAAQLIDLARRKRARHAELPLKDFLRRLRQGTLQKGWDIDGDELTWVMRRVCVALGGTDDDVPLCHPSVHLEALPATALRPLPSAAPIESIVDRVRRELKLGLPIAQRAAT